MTQSFPETPVIIGISVTITCETRSANPTPTIAWTRGGTSIEESDTYTITTSERAAEYNGNIRISSLLFVTAEEHRGHQFSCSVPGDDFIPPRSSVLVLAGEDSLVL